MKDYIRGITFAAFSAKNQLNSNECLKSFENLKERLNVNYIILVPVGYQDTQYSTTINYDTKECATDEELINLINKIHESGLKVILKPTVNCSNGVWRAHINFFDKDVPCEPKWSDWFKTYTKFQLHYAQMAQETKCEMFIAGCEMVNADRQVEKYGKLLDEVRTVYKGTLSYNCDKYQEEMVKFWDKVDVISSSGYYPIDKWEEELDRIEKVVKQYNKPFFFAEAGSMSTLNSKYTPNDWTLPGIFDLDDQVQWYKAMFKACEKREWVQGFGLWAWSGHYIYKKDKALLDKGYDIFNKPSEKIINNFYNKKAKV